MRHQHAPVAPIGVPNQWAIARTAGSGAFRAQAVARTEARRAIGQTILIADFLHLVHALDGEAQEEFGEDGDDEHDHAAGLEIADHFAPALAPRMAAGSSACALLAVDGLR